MSNVVSIRKFNCDEIVDPRFLAAARRRGAARRPANPRVSVVVPAKNEADNIAAVLPFLDCYHEVIVVVCKDDHASAEAARTALPSARIVIQTRKGKGNAMACGFAEVTGDVIVMFDVDGSADPREIPRFITALTDGADFAKGSRFCRGGGSEDATLLRAWGTMGLTLMASVLTATRFTDLCYGYNAFWTDQLPVLDLPPVHLRAGDNREMVHGDGFEIEALIISRFALAGVHITEVPSFEYNRYHGESNLNTFRDGFRVLRTMWNTRVNMEDTHAQIRNRWANRRHAVKATGPQRPDWMMPETTLTAIEFAA